MPEKFSIGARLASFRHAASGLRTLLLEQHNCRIHLVATMLVVTLGVFLGISRYDWMALLLSIGLVWTAEALNSALEYLSDAAVPQQHPLIGKAKDSAAAAVLISALLAVAVGWLVFTPYLKAML